MTDATTATVTTLLLKKHGIRSAHCGGLTALDPARCRFVGRAVTARYVPLREDRLAEQSLSNANALMHTILASLKPGDVLVLDGMGVADTGLIGDVIAARLKAIGVAGVVADGAVRDAAEIRGLGLPVFCKGAAPPPSFTRLMLADMGCPVGIGGATVFPGDTIMGDEDGVVVLPAALAGPILTEAAEQDAAEKWIRLRVEAGEVLAGLYPPSEATMAQYRSWVAAGSDTAKLVP
ncbi:RraA family protein [Elioraea rosea]|uniref:RraA family protein n=1 Tax=Elioraea rosea TaxID=2492390 RepID=UPI001181F189|nr:ribonuclease activity regulator RraA [Elioraea rosea]